MSKTAVTMDELTSDIDNHLQETDTAYIAALAERVCGGSFRPLSDGETIRHDGVKHSFESVIQDITHAIGNMEPADAAQIATELLTSDFEVDEDGVIHAVTPDETPAP